MYTNLNLIPNTAQSDERVIILEQVISEEIISEAVTNQNKTDEQLQNPNNNNSNNDISESSSKSTKIIQNEEKTDAKIDIQIKFNIIANEVKNEDQDQPPPLPVKKITKFNLPQKSPSQSSLEEETHHPDFNEMDEILMGDDSMDEQSYTGDLLKFLGKLINTILFIFHVLHFCNT